MQGIVFTLLYNQWPLFPDTELLFLHQLLVSKNMLLLGDEWPGCSSYQGSWWFLLAMEPLLEKPRSLDWNPWQTVGCWCQADQAALPREVLTRFAQISSFQGSDWSTEEWDGGLIMWLLFGPKWCCLNLGDQLIQYPVKESWQSIETGLKMTNHRLI